MKKKDTFQNKKSIFNKLKSKISYNKVAFFTGIVTSFILLAIYIFSFLLTPYVDKMDDIRNTVNENRESIIAYAKDLKNNKSNVVNLDYNGVKIDMKEENNIVNINAKMSVSVFRSNTIEYVFFDENLKEMSVDDGLGSSIFMFVFGCFLIMLIGIYTYFIMYFIKVMIKINN